MVCVVLVWVYERESCFEGDGFRSFRIGFVRERERERGGEGENNKKL